MTVQVGLKWMGVMTLAVTLLLAFTPSPPCSYSPPAA